MKKISPQKALAEKAYAAKQAATASSATDDDPLVDRNDLLDFGINYHPSHLRRMWMDGRFPRPHRLTPRKLVWRRSSIKAWIAEKLNEASSDG